MRSGIALRAIDEKIASIGRPKSFHANKVRVRVPSLTHVRDFRVLPGTRVGNLHHELRQVLFWWPCNHVETPSPWISALDLLLLQDNNFTPCPRIDISRRRIVYQFELFPRSQQVAVTSFFESLYQPGSCEGSVSRVLVAALLMAGNGLHELVHSVFEIDRGRRRLSDTACHDQARESGKQRHAALRSAERNKLRPSATRLRKGFRKFRPMLILIIKPLSIESGCWFRRH